MNNSVILLKCIEELEAEKPRIDFVLGALATLVEMQGSYTLEERYREPLISPVEHSVVSGKIGESAPDEASILDGMAKAALTKMPPLQTE